MFTYSQGKLYAKGVSFDIPEKFFINSDPAITGDELIDFVSPDLTYSVMVSIEYSCEGTKQELEKFLSDDAGGIPLGNIEEITVDSFLGHQLFFNGGCEQYQLRLSLCDANELVVHIGTRKPNYIETIVKSDEIQLLINSICHYPNK